MGIRSTANRAVVRFTAAILALTIVAISIVGLGAAFPAACSAQVQEPDDSRVIDLTAPPEKGLSYKRALRRQIDLSGVVDPVNAAPRRLRQLSTFELVHVDVLKEIRDGAVYAVDRDFEVAHTLTSIKAEGLPTPNLEENAEPYVGYYARYSRAQHLSIARRAPTEPDQPFEELEGEVAERIAVALEHSFRFPHPILPASATALGVRWTISSERIAASTLFGRFVSPQTLSGNLTARLVRRIPKHHVNFLLVSIVPHVSIFPLKIWTKVEEAELMRPHPCALIEAIGDLEIVRPGRPVMKLSITARYYFSLTHNLVVEEWVQASASVGWRTPAYAYELRGPYTQTVKVSILETR